MSETKSQMITRLRIARDAGAGFHITDAEMDIILKTDVLPTKRCDICDNGVEET